jgi:cytoskeletal protein RodZ
MKTLSRETSLLQQEQVERLMQIGAYLHHIREESSLSLEDVAAQTMIQARMLKAIEEGKLHHLPEPVYVQGFIRRYAEALGLEGSEFAEAFPAERSLHVAQSSWKDSPAAQLRPLHLYIAYVALIMASVSLLSYVVGRSANPSANSADRVRPQISQAIAPTGGSTTARIQPEAAPTALLEPAKPAQTKPVQIDVKLTAQSWLEVEVDGEVKLAEVLQEGAERTWTADQQIRVRAGNAGGVQVAPNGGKAIPMGAPGAVEEKTFTPTAQTPTDAATAPASSDSPSPQPQ